MGSFMKIALQPTEIRCWLKKTLQNQCLAGFWAVILIFTSTAIYAQDTPLRNRESNPNYEQGDWISYSMARYITSIAIGAEYVYFGTQHCGIIRIDQFQNRWDFPWTTSNGLADNEIWSVAFDTDTGFLWAASHTAVSYYQPTSRKWYNFFKDEFGLPVVDEIVSIGVTPNKIIFISQGGREFEANKFGGTVLLSNNGTDNAYLGRDIRWFGREAQRSQFGNKSTRLPNFFMTKGYLFDPQGFVEDFNFRRAEITVTLEDDWGNMWIGTWGLGAGKGDVRTLRLEMLEFGLANPVVNALALHNDVLWIGGADDIGENVGITAWNSKRESWEYYEQRNISDLESDQIFGITPDEERIWFATGHGLTFFSLKERRWKTFNTFDGLSDNRVFDTVVDDSSVWAGTANGIDRILKKNLLKSKKDSLQVEQIQGGNLTLTEVRDLELMANLLWAATDRGIYVYDISKKEGGYSDEIQGPVTDDIASISHYENELWFGSSHGIDVFDIDKREWLGVPEGRAFPNIPINKILAAQDAVWAGTDQGVLKYNRKDQTWRTFNTEDGLLDNRVNVIVLDGDYIWFGTDLGLTKFYWNDPSRVD